jgi:hypothetical protein
LPARACGPARSRLLGNGGQRGLNGRTAAAERDRPDTVLAQSLSALSALNNRNVDDLLNRAPLNGEI